MKNKYIFHDEFVVMRIYKRNGKQHDVLIDLNDYQRVSSHPYKWCTSSNGLGKIYVHAPTSDGGRVKLHRFLLNPSSEECVDHINGDTLDNRKANLRSVTIQENTQNRMSHNKNNKVGIRGISYISQTGKYRGSTTIKGKRRYTKHCETPQEAKVELQKIKILGTI